jgi:Ca2+-binding EF-hand superfamily protein
MMLLCWLLVAYSGTIEWEEFIIAMSALERGTNERKTRFLFKVYDGDKDGTVSQEELLRFFLSSLMVTPDGELI